MSPLNSSSQSISHAQGELTFSVNPERVTTMIPLKSKPAPIWNRGPVYPHELRALDGAGTQRPQLTPIPNHKAAQV